MEESCSWCHQMNDVRFQYCATCGHEAHRPRMDCCCDQCITQHQFYHLKGQIDQYEHARELQRLRMRDV